MSLDHCNALCGIFLLALWTSVSLALETQQLYPFGSQQGDKRLAVEDDGSSQEIFLNTTIAFYDDHIESLYVNLNGFISFETEIPAYRSNMIIPFGYKIIAPFFADVDTRLSGNVYYRETFDPSLRKKASQDVARAFSGYNHYPISLFIITWDQVGHYDSQYAQTNTFQVVISSDGRDSFAIFLYPEGGINWIKGEGKEYPQADPDAQAGFDAGDNRRFLTLSGSGNKEVQNLPAWSNFEVSGMYIFRIGNTRGQNIETPSSYTRNDNREVSDEQLTCLDGGQRHCDSNANCVDYNSGYCCECVAPYIGNGQECIRPDGPQRISGRVSGTLNGVEIDVDLHAYVVTTDGRTYTAISRMEYALGQSLLSLYPVASILGFLFALPQQPTAKNGFMITGGSFNRTAVVHYQQGRESATIRQSFVEKDVPGNLRMMTHFEGNIPRISDEAKVEIDDYREEYRRVSPGVIKSSSAHTYRVDGTPYRFTIEETIDFKECSARPLTDLAPVKLAVTRNFVVYSEKEQIVRYSQTNKVSLHDTVDDPCRSANCDRNADCLSQQDTYRCVCKAGFEGSGHNHQCTDIDECRLRTNECHANAQCFNTEGSYQCRCHQGYSGDGRVCRPEQPTESCRVLRNCGENSDCVYDSGTQDYVCRCKHGFEGDGYQCQQLQQDDCTLDDYCDQNAACIYDVQTRRYDCRCADGYEGDGKHCTAIRSDCRRDPGVCARNAQCNWDGLTFSCRCGSGYHGDGYHSCSAISTDSSSYLLYAQGMYIMEVPFSPTSTTPGKQTLYIPGQTAIGIDVDCYTRYFYWTDITGKTISRARLDGTDSEVIVRNLNSPEGVAVDWISKNLYWTDSGSDRIEMSRLDGSNHKTLFSDGLVNPRGIAVDPTRGILFWTDWNREAPKVERSNMDGSERRVLASDSLGLPNGLTLDYESQLVCWADAGNRKVECSSYDGRNRRTVSQSAGYPFGLAYNNEILYWTDWEKSSSLPNAIVLPPARNNEDLTLPHGANGRTYGLATVKRQCPPGSNPCAHNNGGCRFLCLPVKGGRTCTCPDDIDPEECNRIALL